MKKSLKNKKILILGGNPETKALVDVANEMGLSTIVLDANLNAPAKKTATIGVYVESLNWVTISSGMGGLRYAL